MLHFHKVGQSLKEAEMSYEALEQEVINSGICPICGAQEAEIIMLLLCSAFERGLIQGLLW